MRRTAYSSGYGDRYLCDTKRMIDAAYDAWCERRGLAKNTSGFGKMLFGGKTETKAQPQMNTDFHR